MKLVDLFFENSLDTADVLKYDKAISKALSNIKIVLPYAKTLIHLEYLEDKLKSLNRYLINYSGMAKNDIALQNLKEEVRVDLASARSHLTEAKKKLKSRTVRKKLQVKHKRHRRHVHPVKKVTDENIIGDLASKAATWAAGKVLAKLGTGGA